MRKKGLISILLAMFLIAFTGSAFAWSPSIEGKPDQFSNGGPKGYYIWHINVKIKMFNFAHLKMYTFSHQ